MNSDLLSDSAAAACVSVSLTISHSSCADGWTCWLLWCKSAHSETSSMACCKLGGHLNCPLEVDLRLLCSQFKLEGPSPTWSGSYVATLAWTCAHRSQSYPSMSVTQLLVQSWLMSCQPGPQTQAWVCLEEVTTTWSRYDGPHENFCFSSAFTSPSSSHKAIFLLLFSWFFYSTEPVWKI